MVEGRGEGYFSKELVHLQSVTLRVVHRLDGDGSSQPIRPKHLTEGPLAHFLLQSNFLPLDLPLVFLLLLGFSEAETYAAM